MKIFRNFNENELVPGIEEVIPEDKTTMYNPEDMLTVHIIPYEVESARTNKNINSSEPMYLKKVTGKDAS